MIKHNLKKKHTLSRSSSRKRKLRRVLIVCEGKKTEPNYFKGFENNPKVFDGIEIQGTGYNTMSLIKEAIRIKNEALQKKEPYIETWCVFDKDDFSDELFINAIKLANENQIKCAYSIESFEIWYLLHFNYIDAALTRHQYIEKLSERLKEPYRKNDTRMYLKLKKSMNNAINNAKKLYIEQCRKPFKDQNPITTVYKLVERLL